MKLPATLSLTAPPGFPLVRPGDDLAVLVLAACGRAGCTLGAGDVVVLAQKIVSKAEGRQVPLAQVQPSARALELAERVDKDPRLVELVLRESVEVLRAVNGVLITENRHGLIMANAGLDMSNIEHSGPEDDTALLLPEDPDASAARIRRGLETRAPAPIGVVICDSVGRAWREATVGLAIGVSGIPARVDLRGGHDLFGRELRVAEVALGDCIAAAASIVMGEGAEGRPFVVVRGFDPARAQTASTARSVVRPRDRDLFR